MKLKHVFFPHTHYVGEWRVGHRKLFSQRLREWIGAKLQSHYKVFISLRCPYDEASRRIKFFFLVTECEHRELQWIEDIYAFFYIYPEY